MRFVALAAAGSRQWYAINAVVVALHLTATWLALNAGMLKEEPYVAQSVVSLMLIFAWMHTERTARHGRATVYAIVNVALLTSLTMFSSWASPWAGAAMLAITLWCSTAVVGSGVRFVEVIKEHLAAAAQATTTTKKSE
jgi:hypothetical protein